MTEPRPAASRRIHDLLESLSFVAVIGGVIVGFSEHFALKASDARAAAESVYDGLDAEYRSMLTLRIAHPRLDLLVHETGPLPADATAAERAQVHSYFSLAIDLYERAWLGYHDPDQTGLVSEATRNQWGGWEESIDQDLQSPEFVATWKEIGTGFDQRFQDYLNRRIASLPATR